MFQSGKHAMQRKQSEMTQEVQCHTRGVLVPKRKLQASAKLAIVRMFFTQLFAIMQVVKISLDSNYIILCQNCVLQRACASNHSHTHISRIYSFWISKNHRSLCKCAHQTLGEWTQLHKEPRQRLQLQFQDMIFGGPSSIQIGGSTGT